MDVDSYLDRLLPLREMLIEGDLRPLFLAWLACSYDDDEKLPPIPSGLNEMNDALEALAEFYEIPTALIQVAAADSAPAPQVADKRKAIQNWVVKQSKTVLEKAVVELLTEDSAAARAKTMSKFKKSVGTTPWPTTSSNSTLGELRSAANI